MYGIPFVRRRGGHVVWSEGLSQCLRRVNRATELPVFERHQDKGLQGFLREEDLVLVIHK